MKYFLICKKYFIYIALLVTLLAAAYFKYHDLYHANSTNVVGVVERQARSAYNQKNQGEIDRLIMEKNLSFNSKVDIFEIYRKTISITETKRNVHLKAVFQLNAAIVSPALEIQPPIAPNIPFKYIGKIWGDDEYQVFIGLNGKNLIIKEGDTIQQTYKVERISPPTMTLTYLPMNILQSMQVGEPN